MSKNFEEDKNTRSQVDLDKEALLSKLRDEA